MDAIKDEPVGYVFNVEVEIKPQVAPEVAEQIDVLADASQTEAGAAIAAAAAVGSQPTSTGAPTIQAPGLQPNRPEHMEYSAPDESGGVMHGEMESDDDGIIEVDPGASRAERRRAERQNRKKRR
jgi:preprotein translocase subunit SecA